MFPGETTPRRAAYYRKEPGDSPRGTRPEKGAEEHMGTNDARNPLSYILPAGVLAYIASPQVRKAVRETLVRGMAGVMDLADRAETASSGLRDEFQAMVADADRLRREKAEPTVRIEVEDADDDDTPAPPSGAERAPA